MKGLDALSTVGNGCISADSIAGHNEKSAAVIHLHLALATTSRREAAAADEVDTVAGLRSFRICLHLTDEFSYDVIAVTAEVSLAKNTAALTMTEPHSPKELTAAVEAAGYKVTRIE